jgi:hypothetical protein
MIVRKKINIVAILLDIISTMTFISGIILALVLFKKTNVILLSILMLSVTLYTIIVLEMYNTHKIKDRYWKRVPLKYTKFNKTKINSGAYKIKKKLIQF